MYSNIEKSVLVEIVIICIIQAYETNEHTNTTGMCVLVEILLLKCTKTQVHSTHRHSESTQLQVVNWIYRNHRNERSGQNRSIQAY